MLHHGFRCTISCQPHNPSRTKETKSQQGYVTGPRSQSWQGEIMLVKLLTTTPSISSGLTDKRQRRTEKGEEGGRGEEKGKKGIEFHPQKINPPPDAGPPDLAKTQGHAYSAFWFPKAKTESLQEKREKLSSSFPLSISSPLKHSPAYIREPDSLVVRFILLSALWSI